MRRRAKKEVQGVIAEAKKFVDDTAPKVQLTVTDTMERSSEAFKRTMKTIDHQTRPQQAKFLEMYKKFLQQQLERVEKRLGEVKAGL